MAFTHRVAVAVAMVVAAVAALSIVVVGLDVLLLAFAGVLFALFLRGVARGLAWATRLGDGAALALTVALLLALAGLAG